MGLFNRTCLLVSSSSLQSWQNGLMLLLNLARCPFSQYNSGLLAGLSGFRMGIMTAVFHESVTSAFSSNRFNTEMTEMGRSIRFFWLRFFNKCR